VRLPVGGIMDLEFIQERQPELVEGEPILEKP